jgi:hypothetical protein
MRINIFISCVFLVMFMVGCEASVGKEDKNAREWQSILEQERAELQRCIREHLPPREPEAEAWVVSGSAFVSAFEECSTSPTEERPSIFGAVAEKMARPEGDLTRLIIFDIP